MHIAQRVLLVMAIVIFFILGATVICRAEEKLQNQWESTQTELFLKKICRTGSLSLDEYIYYDAVLNYSGIASEIEIEVYRKEQDMEGKLYYYLISWEELNGYFMEECNYIFETESVIKIEIDRRSRNNSVRNIYYDIIPGKEWENNA